MRSRSWHRADDGSGLRRLGCVCGRRMVSDGWLCVSPPDDLYGRPRLRLRGSLSLSPKGCAKRPLRPHSRGKGRSAHTGSGVSSACGSLSTPGRNNRNPNPNPNPNQAHMGSGVLSAKPINSGKDFWQLTRLSATFCRVTRGPQARVGEMSGCAGVAWRGEAWRGGAGCGVAWRGARYDRRGATPSGPPSTLPRAYSRRPYPRASLTLPKHTQLGGAFTFGAALHRKLTWRHAGQFGWCAL